MRCLVRKAGTAKVLQHKLVETVSGDVTRPDTLRGKLDGCDAVIHLVAIIKENKSKKGKATR